MTVKSLLVLLCIILAVFITSSVYSDSNVLDVFDLNNDLDHESRFPLKLSWLIGDYDLDRIEEYIDENYISYYKIWERYLTTKQREFASNFGLTNIVFKPDFKQYEDTKLVLSKSVWKDRLTFRYMAPISNMWKFDASIAIRPYRFITFIGRGGITGEGDTIRDRFEVSALIVVNKALGRESGKYSRQQANYIVKTLEKLSNRF